MKYRYKIYLLLNKEGVPFYVGATTNILTNRLYQHIRCAMNGTSKNAEKDAYIFSRNSEISIKEVEVTYSKEEAEYLEQYWILKLRMQNVFLVNREATNGIKKFQSA